MAKNRPNQFKGAAPVTEPTTDNAAQEAQSQEASLQAEQTGDTTAAPQDTQASTEGAVQQDEPQATEAPASTEAPAAIEAPAVTQAPVATEAPAETAAPAAAPAVTQAPSAETTVEAGIARLQERLAAPLVKAEQIVRDTLNTYLDELKPGRPAQPVHINRNQVMLWRLILRVIETPDDVEFEKALTLLVDYFRAHRKGALGEYYVFRGMDTITLDQDTTAAFQRAINLLIICATVSGPKEVSRHADLGRSLPEGVYSDNARNRLLGFLS